MKAHTEVIRQALQQAVSSTPIAMADVSQILESFRVFISSTDQREKALLGLYALDLLVTRLKSDIAAERESKMLLDKIRNV